MSNDKKVSELDEKVLEEEALKETSDDELRKSIVEKYEFDEDIDSELINKFMEDKKEERKKLSTAIGQKIKKREELQELQKKQEKPELPKPKPEEDINKVLDEKFRQRELQSFDVSDELQEKIEDYAALHPELSAKKVFVSSYIQFLKKEEDDKARAEAAGISKTHKGKTTPDYSNLSSGEEIVKAIAELDLATGEGRKQHKALKQRLKEL